MADLPAYEFPSRATSGLLFGLSAARLATLGFAGIVAITTLTHPTPTGLLAGVGLIVVLLAVVGLRVGGRPVVDWLPVWVAFGWQQATRNNEFYATPDLSLDLPEGMLDLPGELFGVELHHHADPTATASVSNPTPAAYGIVRDTLRRRLVAIAELSGDDFLFLDPADQQARITSWGRTLDHLAQTMPDITRLQVVHTVGPPTTTTLHAHHHTRGGRGTAGTANSYRQVLADAGRYGHTHRTLLAIALDLTAARRAIRQAGGGTDGAAAVLMDRATVIEDTLTAAGITVHGWLPTRTIAHVLHTAFDPHPQADGTADVNAGGGTDPAVAGPAGMVDSWAHVRHDSGWSTTLQIIRPPTRPATGDFLQHLLIGIAARRRLSLLYLPTPAATAERRAQTQQVSAESEQALRARWGFSASARQRRQQQDAARREEDLVEGRTVYRVVWLITVTGTTPAELDAAVGQVEAAARRCSLETRRMAGTQRQAFAATLPLCRGAR